MQLNDLPFEDSLPKVFPPYLPDIKEMRLTLVLDLDETLVHYKENFNGEDHHLLV